MISHQGDISVLNGFAFLYCKGIKLYAFSQKTTVTKQPYVALCKTWFFFRTFLLSSRLYCRFRNWSCLTGSAYARGLYRRSGTSPCPEEFSFFLNTPTCFFAFSTFLLFADVSDTVVFYTLSERLSRAFLAAFTYPLPGCIYYTK